MCEVSASPACPSKEDFIAGRPGGGVEAIHDEVQAWDVSALPSEYLMARLVLLRQDGPALDLLRKLVTEDAVPVTALEEWPLFDRLRDQGLLAEFPSRS